MIVLHATVGSFDSARSWLTSPSSKVSTHYLIRKDGYIAQLVDESRAAWHAGVSEYGALNSEGVKLGSIGIELENANDGHDPYPLAQLSACRALILDIFSRMPPPDITTHAIVARPVGRKTDPAGFPLVPFLASLSIEPTPRYTEDSPLLATLPQPDAATVRGWIPGARDLAAEIGDCYADVCARGGVDVAIAVAQMLHETGGRSSWWSQYPRSNPAGLGVTGETKPGRQLQPSPAELWHFDQAANKWRKGNAFTSWSQSIPAQIGRLLAYALPEGHGSGEQIDLIDYALSVRALPPAARGSVGAVKHLGAALNPSGVGWASPGDSYGSKLAFIANRLRGWI